MTEKETNATIGLGSNIKFNLKTSSPSIIKVIGVGGGGGNAVNHMYREGIHDVSFLVCNTDNQALNDSPIPTRLQLGTEGLGAGNKPEKAKKAAEESIDSIKDRLSDGTRMVFITAGMGGGTGTGAAPVIAQCAKEMGILTVGIVTIPFLFEGIKKINQALDGVEEISKHVDALLVINNERLREIYPAECAVLDAFAQADDTLSIAAKSIAEIITVHGIVNLDFQDVTTVLKDGGVAIMSTGYGEGEGRVRKAIESALRSPLLNNNDIFHSKKVLLNILFCNQKDSELTMEEMNEVHDFMSRFGNDVETKFGIAIDSSLDKKVKITVLATGFGLNNVPGLEDKVFDEEDPQKTKRRETYYPDAPKETNRPRHIFIFTDDNLDNDEVITLVEDTPTFKRSKESLADIKNKTSLKTEEQPETTEDLSAIQTKIVFS